LTEKLLTALKTEIKSYTLVPSSGGCFELTINGELIYSKLKTDQFPDEAAMVEEAARRAKK
jgi:selenoprotein W-related protein